MNNILNNVCCLAMEVGHFQARQRLCFQAGCVQTKRSHDYVSYVDRESEQMIVDGLKKILPEAGFITEEKTTEQDLGENDLVWVVDPLDGTTNFIHDLGPWCVCIALKRGADLLLGVVYEVTRDELFYASNGQGAWLKHGEDVKRISVSTTTDLEQALIAVGYPYDAEAYRDFCTAMSARLYGHCASLRSLGSAETELCYVAAGRLDVYFESFLQPWDVCAGAVILLEAGGHISDYHGRDANWQNGRQVLATNSQLHSPMIATMQEFLTNE